MKDNEISLLLGTAKRVGISFNMNAHYLVYSATVYVTFYKFNC
jgi:hypothetical protein